MQENKTFSGWVREHRKLIMITGMSAAVIIGGIAIGKNWYGLCGLEEELLLKPRMGDIMLPSSKNITDIALVKSGLPELEKTATSAVNSFLRNLPEGYHASAVKMATAAENGFELISNQT